MEDVEEAMKYVRGEDSQDSRHLSLMEWVKVTGLDTWRIGGRSAIDSYTANERTSCSKQQSRVTNNAYSSM
jgi:hypothetical protein